MILLLGATGYVGQAFARALRRRKDSFIPLSRKAFDYTQFEFLFDYVRKIGPDLVVNAAGTPDSPSGDAGELERMEMLQMNTLLPQTIARVCALTNTAWAHVSSGSIYSGAKVFENGRLRVEEDLCQPATRELFMAHPEKFRGFSEVDEPNFSFKRSPCSFYSGTKALAEEAVRNTPCYIWRFRLPFNEQDEPLNFLSQLQDGLKLHNAINSLSHLDDCVSACLELWERRAAFGIYNVVNPGAVCTQEVVQMIQRILKPAGRFQLMVYNGESGHVDRKVLRADCILDVSKLLKTGVKLPTVNEALEGSLEKWQPQTSPILRTFA
jgi:dTDP-4-dehydrorhamnose reductase